MSFSRVRYLAKVIKPDGMNFQEFTNLSPITTAKVPAVPACTDKHDEERKAAVITALPFGEQREKTHPMKAKHSWDF